jgi:hypothetical protein
MGKAARHREKRQREEQRQRAHEDAQREALIEAGYPVKALRKVLAEQGEVMLDISENRFDDGGPLIIGKIANISVGAGPRVYVVVQLDEPDA